MRTANKLPLLLAAGALALLVLTRRDLTVHQPKTATERRQEVVRLALAEKGHSDPLPYWSEVSGPEEHPSTSWCGAFVLWVLRTAGLTSWTYDQAGAWFYRLPQTHNPRPGDIIFFPDSRHLALITSVSDTELGLVDGAGTGGRVSTRTVKRAKLGNVEMFSIDPLIEAAT